MADTTNLDEIAIFKASFPCIQSAIKIHGSGDGMRIQFDIPASEMAEAVKMLAWTERILTVTVKPEDDENCRKSYI